MIEKGRHSSPIIPVTDTLCKYCDLREVENEYHFVMKCKLYNLHHAKLLSDIDDTFVIDNLSPDDIFLLIMSATDFDHLQLVIKFINLCFQTRSSSR